MVLRKRFLLVRVDGPQPLVRIHVFMTNFAKYPTGI